MRTALFLVLAAICCLSAVEPVAEEEFVGPFASWKDVKSFGAVGDGKADDTAALKAGLESLAIYGKAKPDDPYVLWLPAGTYRITAPLVWENRLGVSVLGEDPATTVIRYDGPPGQAILTCHGVSYSKFGRITWDGQGKAKAAVAHQWNPVTKVGPAVTYMEHADEVFQDVDRGIIGGAVVPVINQDGSLASYNHGMDAETLIKRCRFIRCREAGLSIQSFNALDWWVWDSEFVDCGTGATNCAPGEYGGGHFHLYRNLFRGSKIADVRTGHGSYFGIRLNTSIGSRRFVETTRPTGFSTSGLVHPTIKLWGAWQDQDTHGSQQSLQGNRIIDPGDATPIHIDQHGPLVMLDNTFVVQPGSAPVVLVAPPTSGAKAISIGNRFFGAAGVVVQGGDLTQLDDQTLDIATADRSEPALSPTAPRLSRRVFETKAGAQGSEIQAAIDAAVKLVGQKPVVHLPAGRFPVAATLSIPAGADLQLVGDGQETVLVWEGPNDGTMLRLAGPARATLRDFRIAGIWNKSGTRLGRGIVASGLDQPDGQILLEQTVADNCTRLGMRFAGLAKTRVETRGSGSGGCEGPGLVVEGAGDQTTAWVGFFGSAGSNNQQTHVVRSGGNLVVWDTWYETAVAKKNAEPRYIHLTDRGNLTFFNGHIATLPGKDARTDLPTIELDGFSGRFTLIGTQLNTMNPQLRLAGTGSGMKALVLATAFGDSEPWLEMTAPGAELTVLACTKSGKPLPYQGTPSAAILRDMLAQARTVLPTRWRPAPAGATDLRLHRVKVYVKVGEGMVFADAAAD